MKKYIGYLTLIINLIAFYLMPVFVFADFVTLNLPSWLTWFFAPPLGFIGFIIIFALFQDVKLGWKFRIIAKYVTLSNLLFYPLVIFSFGLLLPVLPVAYVGLTGYFVYVLFIKSNLESKYDFLHLNSKKLNKN